MDTIKLGDTVRDRITNVKGVMTGYAELLERLQAGADRGQETLRRQILD